MMCKNCSRFIVLESKYIKNKSYIKCANCGCLNIYTPLEKKEETVSANYNLMPLIIYTVIRAAILFFIALTLILLNDTKNIYYIIGIFIYGLILQLIHSIIFKRSYEFDSDSINDKIFLILDIVISIILFIFVFSS